MKKVFITFITSFLFGVIFCFYIQQNYASQLWISSWKDLKYQQTLEDKPLDLSDFWEVYDILEKDYFSHGEVNKKDLVRWAITGMVDSLWDKHSEYMSPDIHEKFQEALEWDFEWIGAVVDKTPLWVKVDRILKGSPAKKYGIRSWDIIIQADETVLEGMNVYDAVEYIKWPAGTQVDLRVIRPWEEQILEISVLRAKIHIPSIEEEYYEDTNIAYISINMFGEQTADEFIKALENVKHSWADGLIIDVRDNGGWYLQSAVLVLSEFIKKKEVLVKTKYTDSYFNQNYYSVNDGETFDGKIVVLINGNSASASEITAGALSEYNKAILVGKKSYGKWSVQQPFDMKDGSLLKLTVAKWFTPKGKNIDDEWIEPDVEVDFIEEDYVNSYDRQLEEAKKVLEFFREKRTTGLAIEAYNESIASENNELEE